MPTVARILELAPIAQYLASNRVSKGTLFSNPPLDPRLPITIYMVRKILQRVYDEDPNYTGVRVVADYLYELIQGFAFKAAAIADGNTGGQVAPPTPGTGTAVNDLDFIVSASSYIATGESAVTFDGTGGMPDLRGYDVDFARNGTTQYTTPQAGGALYYAWNRVTGVFQLLGTNPEALEGESFRIMPDATGGTSSSTVSTWSTLVITSAAFEPDGVTCNLATIVGSEYMLFVTGFNSEWQFAGTFFDYTATGFVVIWPGFDAANFSNIIIQKIN